MPRLFPSATSSFTDRAGTFGCNASTSGTSASVPTGRTTVAPEKARTSPDAPGTVPIRAGRSGTAPTWFEIADAVTVLDTAAQLRGRLDALPADAALRHVLADCRRRARLHLVRARDEERAVDRQHRVVAFAHVSYLHGGRIDPGWGALAGHIVFLVVLAVRPQGLLRGGAR